MLSPYCPDRRLLGDSRTVLRPSAASGKPLVQQGTPVQQPILRCLEGLKAVPKGPPSCENRTSSLVDRGFSGLHLPTEEDGDVRTP